jgi:hypothetical protein
MNNCQVLSLWRLVLSAMQFNPLVMAHGALEEPTSSDAHASKRWLIVRRSASYSLPIMQDRVLILDLTLRGVVPVNGLITNDDAAWRWVASSFLHALACCVLMAEMLSGE